MSERKNTYFASDLHLGAPTYEKSREREVLFVQWLDSIEPTAKEIYLLGDVFDFWFEFKSTIPKGYARLQGKLAELTDKGIPIYWMKGNHDMWMFGYLEKELGVQIIDQPVLKTFGDKQFYLAHGDGLGPKQRTYKLIRKFFRSWFAQRLFAFLHPTFGIWLASSLSHKSRESHSPDEEMFLGEEKEFLIIHSKKVLESQDIDYFVYGHRHSPLVFPLNNKSTYVNLGDWISKFSYGVFDGENMSLEYFTKK